MANARRLPLSHGRAAAAALVLLAGLFIAAAGLGMRSGAVVALGILFGLGAAAFWVLSALRSRLAGLVEGTGHVVAVSDPPAGVSEGRCELTLVVEAPGLIATAVRYRGSVVPLAKWPAPGATLPVLVDPEDPRTVEVVWDKAPSHHIGATGRVPVRAARVPSQSSPGGNATGRAAGTAVADPPTTVDGAAGDGPADSDLPAQDAAAAPSPAEDWDEEDLDAVPLPALVRDVGVTLVVSHLETSLAFYRDLLGFTEIDTGAGAVMLVSGNGRVLLRQREGSKPKPPRLMHLTLDVADVDAAYRELLARGIEFLHPPRVVVRGEHLELWAASCYDPDGHGLALTRWRFRE